MTTARAIITNALASAGVLADGQPIESDDAQRALTRLNDMVDSWSTQTLFAGSTSELVYNLTGQQSVSIGLTGDIVAPLPNRIHSAFVRVGGYDYPVEIIDYLQYADIRYKTQPSPWPAFAYFDNVGQIYLWPIGPGELHLSVLTNTNQFADLDTDYTLQAGARQALCDSLAEILLDDFDRPPKPALMRRAAQARYTLKRQNLVVPILNSYGPSRGVGGLFSQPDPDGFQGGNAGDMKTANG